MFNLENAVENQLRASGSMAEQGMADPNALKDLIKLLERRGRSEWQDAGQGFEGMESSLQLKAWGRERRVIVLRRPTKRREAKSDLPLLESAQIVLESAQIVLEAGATHEFMARVTQSGRQTTLRVTSTHERAAPVQKRQNWASRFLGKLKEAAEQWTRFDIWRLILSRVFVRFLKGRIIGTPRSTPIQALA